MMLGLAIGDALGAATEFLSYEQIRERFGPDGLTGFAGSVGMFTDDTQMSVAVAEALLRSGQEELETFMGSVRESFLAWLNSPDNFRAPGITTISALRKLEQGAPWRESGSRSSKGCGSVMRTAPIGFFYRDRPERLKEFARAVGLVSHAHPTADAACLGAAYAAALAARGVPLEEWLARIGDFTRGVSAEFDALLARVGEAAAMEDERAAVGRICSPFDGWTADEVLGTALYALLRRPDAFRPCLLLAVNTSGDSDSIGCVAGGLQGLRLGAEAIPPEWVLRVERREELERIGRELGAPHGGGQT